MNINNTSISLGGAVTLAPGSPIKAPAAGTESLHEVSARQAEKLEKEMMEKTPVFDVSRRVPRGVEPNGEEKLHHAKKMMDFLLLGLTEKTSSAINTFDIIEQKIHEKVPAAELAPWDFSINNKNEITVSSPKLSREDQNQIQNLIETSGIMESLIEIKTFMIEGLEHDRTTALYSSDIGRFDLTEDNFSDIVNFKEYLSDARAEIATSVFSAVNALNSQLELRAVEEYNKKLPSISAWA